MSLSAPVLAAGLLGIFTAFVHLIAGRKAPLLPMLRADFDPVSRKTMHVVWHIVTADLFLAAGALIYCGLHGGASDLRGLTLFIALHYLIWSGLFVAIALTSSLERPLLKLPQWLLLLPSGVLTLLGGC